MKKSPSKENKSLFSPAEDERLVAAIREAERMTSGEIRLYVESHCSFVDPMDRAREVFAGLNMQHTRDHNGVLVYLALKDRQFAIYGDEGMHRKVGEDFWKEQALQLLSFLRKGAMVEGLETCVKAVGVSLREHFPYEPDDENELPDDIVFGL
ncbi:TPM domain-containing protein [Compostibacter hankyongensis]|uniref:TPM domain-containing protein n=1 Tax=Compostibacter hankyongensis TaxID=1007089 RepID=A0ABP8FTX7_9BACT